MHKRLSSCLVYKRDRSPPIRLFCRSDADPPPKAGPKKSDPPIEYMRFRLTDTCQLVLSRGDITSWVGDAIVNAANEQMLGGGGVDGAEGSHRRGFELPVKYVIHTVGPIYEDEEESPPLLASAYRNSLRLANEHELRTVAFPAISCGIYGYPIPAAAQVALSTIQQECGSLHEVHFVMFGMDTFQPFMKEAKQTLAPVTSEHTAGAAAHAAVPTAPATATAAAAPTAAASDAGVSAGAAPEQVVLEERPVTTVLQSPVGLPLASHSATLGTDEEVKASASATEHMHAPQASQHAARVAAEEPAAAASVAVPMHADQASQHPGHGAGEATSAVQHSAGERAGAVQLPAVAGEAGDAVMRDASQAADDQAMPDASQPRDEVAMMSQRRDGSEL